jgi:hypothetical protein
VRQEGGVLTTTGDPTVVSAESNPNKETPPQCEPKRLFYATSKAPVSYGVTRSVPGFQRRNQQLKQKSALSGQIAAVKAAWAAMKQKHARDAIFGYLEAVFELVMLYSRRNQADRLVRRVLKMERFPVQKMDPSSAIIRCTSEKVDRKTISRWSRALRFVANRKDPETPLKTFMIEAGGVNACADRYARHFGQGGRRDYSEDHGCA